MCLGALYWARPRRVFFATPRDAAVAAGFDDGFIYDELARSFDARDLETHRIAVAGAGSEFEAWSTAPDRKEYSARARSLAGAPGPLPAERSLPDRDRVPPAWPRGRDPLCNSGRLARRDGRTESIRRRPSDREVGTCGSYTWPAGSFWPA